VAQIFQRGIMPSAVEFMERSAIQTSAAWLGVSFPGMNDEALLLCECDGHDSQAVDREFLFLGQSLLDFGAKNVVVAENAAKQEELWRVRRAAGEAVKKSSIYKEEDVVVPRARIPDALDCVQHILREKYGLTCVCYGHAGDGNIHVNILKANTPDEVWADISGPITEFFQAIVALGGTLTGEHGVGYVQRSYLPLALGPDEIALMHRLKTQFDPRGILNPCKIFPDLSV
jgi:glycolate oxidase